jgi:tRNA/rRNA methyltransferase
MIIDFILVSPAEPGNVGAAARALKTCGFNQMILINSELHKNKTAQILAHGSKEILENAIYYKNFEELPKDYDYLIATTSKARNVKQEYISSEEIWTFIDERKNGIKKIGIVFGNEESGLSNEHVLACDIVTKIPIATNFPSLNLSQAVMIYAYELSKKNHSIIKVESSDEDFSQQHFNQKIEQYLISIEADKKPALFAKAKQLFMEMNNSDAKVLMSLINLHHKKQR